MNDKRIKLRHIISLAMCASVCAPAICSTRNLFDSGWKFSLDPDSASVLGKYDDRGWMIVDLPHDWSVLNNFDRNHPAGNDGGYLPTGRGAYRKNLHLDSLASSDYSLYLEGAYMDSKVYVNGTLAGNHPYGYTSYRVNLTPYLHEGDNTISISVDNSHQKNSRWYSGSGLYRHVWLERRPRISILPESIQITTPRTDADRGLVQLKFAIADLSKSGKDEKCEIRLTVSDSDGERGSVTESVNLPGKEGIRYLSYEIPVESPSLWSPDSPSLYTLGLEISDEAGNKDLENTTFGFRTIEYSAEKGFLINGIPVNISGACLHHDNGILGAASYDDAEYRKARIIKEAGFNAVRTSHNPPAPAFLDACDRLGLLVIDEAFDGWREAKNPYDYAAYIDKWWQNDISSMVKRDRNHPSVICWSIGNEILERKSAQAVRDAHDFASLCRSLDPSRPVTQAFAAWDSDWEIYDALGAEHDIMGYNYVIHKAEGDHLRVPTRVMWQTESYPRDAYANSDKVKRLPYVIGDFVWTGIDYIGESGIGRNYYEGDPEGEHWERPLWPWHNSQCGDIDITGHRKPVSYYREMLYSDTPMLYMAVKEPDGYRGKIKETLWSTYPSYASWNWHGMEGKPITVQIYSTCPRVRLYQDGNLIGEKESNSDNEYMVEFEIPYSPGTLRSVGLDGNGSLLRETALHTAGRPYGIRLKADRTVMESDGQSLAYVMVEIVDKAGNVVPDDDRKINFDIKGAGQVIATGSADPKDPEGYHRRQRTTHQGRALAIIKSIENEAGEIILKASSPGIKAASVGITSK